MCGIYGEFRLDGAPPAGGLEGVRARLERLAHRGPDGWGVAAGDWRAGTLALGHNRLPAPEASPTFALGHRRLSILDLSDAALQPMLTPGVIEEGGPPPDEGRRRHGGPPPDEGRRPHGGPPPDGRRAEGPLAIVFNGEVYNFAELRAELRALGRVFRTDHSDTEVLLQAFATWGEAAVSRLRGMFAFAVLCRRERRVFLARDRIGQKPLYYLHRPDVFAFASELGALDGLDGAPAVDPVGLARYLALGYVPDPGTIFTGRAKLPPAHCAWLDLDTGRLDVRRYWSVPATDEAGVSGREWEARTRVALARAVKYRLVADVPLGFFLSGGVDSTLVVKYARQAAPEQPLLAFTADFPTRGFSERRWVERSAAHYGLELRPVMVDLSRLDAHAAAIDCLDEPFDGGSAMSSDALFREARGQVKVVLTGDGGDELFAGYDRYRAFARRAARLAAARRLPGGEAALRLLSALPLRRLQARRALLAGDALRDYLLVRNRPGLLGLLRRPGDVRETFAFADPLVDALRDASPLRAVRTLELGTILPGRMLFKLDRYSMAQGIEGRSPFMDHELVELAFRIPDRHLVERHAGKRPLRRIVAADLGWRFVHRRKVGFGNPLATWFAPAGRDRLLAGLRAPDAPIWDVLDRARVRARFTALDGGALAGDAANLWRLVVLARFLARGR